MNKRLFIVSKDETPDFMKYYGVGLDPSSIIVLSRTDPRKPETAVPIDSSQLDLLMNLGDGDGAMLLDKESFDYLRQFYHFGIRSENFFDCSKLKRLSIEGGAFVYCVYDGNIPEKENLNWFMSPEFTKHVDFSWFKHKIVHTVQESIQMLDYFDSLPEDTNFGFDYEASGMPLDVQFEISGASLCTTQFGGFISFTDCRHNNTPEEYAYLLQRLGAFLEKRQRHVWVYNMQYEFQVSHRMLGVDLYNLCDASVVNVLDGHHLKKFSLKWTAQRVLGATVWDTEFDGISDLIDSMLFIEEGRLKKDKHKVLKVDQNTYKATPEWAELCKRYPQYSAEFEQLILEYWGNPFMCIPSDILGYYCNLDAFYTLMIYEQKKTTYSIQAFEVFMDNIRLACRLHSCGINKWEDYRQSYEKYCIQQLVWGITYCATARCSIKMEKHRPKMAKLSSYTPVAQVLLKNSKFFSGDPLEITKYILSSNIDTLDTASTTGLDEGQLLINYGSEFAEKLLEIVEDAMKEVKMKTRLDEGVIRKKKLLGIVSEKLVPILGLDKLPNPTKQLELEKYLYYEKAFLELQKISKKQLSDIQNIPDQIVGFGRRMNLQEYSDYISENYFKCKSPIENDEICKEFSQLFSTETTFLASIFNSSQQLNNDVKFYSSLGIETIEDAFNHYMNSWKNYVDSGGINCGDYPEKVFNLSGEFYAGITKNTVEFPEKVKDIWSNFDGFKAQSMFFKYVEKQYLDYCKPFDSSDLENRFGFMRKMVINYLLFKKYSKILTTYIGTFDKNKGENVGMFLATDKWVIENPENHVVIREAVSKDEPGAVRKMFAKFAALEKSSKRWSSGYHTIISHSDIKSTIRSYPGCLLSYFDISSAEVKSAGYQSGDENLIYMFLNGIDVYVATAKIYLGEENWEKLDGKAKKKWRKNFKQIFLGILYGLGRATLASNLNTSEEEAQRIIDAVYKAYPKLREYVSNQQKYPFNHDGCINTFFGDRLQVDEWRFYKNCQNSREKRSLESRISRLAVNLPIQGGTSAAMSSGFYNDLRVAINEGWNLTSFITVHDSNTCNFPVEKLWDIRSFYDENFTEFCYKMTGIKLLFDILIGATYQDACEAKQIDKDTVELTGNARSIHMILDELNYKKVNYTCSINPESIVPEYVSNPVERFIKEEGCSFVMDTSDYTIQLKRIV